jgi:hypothetical protein
MKIISLGLGIQSTAMYLMSSLGHIERADYAIFADPDAELPDTYNLWSKIKLWKQKNNGIPLIKKKKSLYNDIINAYKNNTRVAKIPAHTSSGGIMLRQCTGEYKIQIVIKEVRRLHKLKKHQRMKPTEMWLGISLDEIQRMKESQLYNVIYKYPLIDKRLTRSDCISFLEQNNFFNVKKSSCTFCPYHNNKAWKEIKQNYPKEWSKAVKLDKVIRNSKQFGIKDELFLHTSLKPLEKAYLQEDQEELFMCEEGYCGI